jgi:hypothetical protein
VSSIGSCWPGFWPEFNEADTPSLFNQNGNSAMTLILFTRFHAVFAESAVCL